MAPGPGLGERGGGRGRLGRQVCRMQTASGAATQRRGWYLSGLGVKSPLRRTLHERGNRINRDESVTAPALTRGLGEALRPRLLARASSWPHLGRGLQEPLVGQEPGGRPGGNGGRQRADCGRAALRAAGAPTHGTPYPPPRVLLAGGWGWGRERPPPSRGCPLVGLGARGPTGSGSPSPPPNPPPLSRPRLFPHHERTLSAFGPGFGRRSSDF